MAHFIKYDGIRAPLHPGSRRCVRSPYSSVRLTHAPCDPGAPAPSVRHRIYETDHLEGLAHLVGIREQDLANGVGGLLVKGHGDRVEVAGRARGVFEVSVAVRAPD